MKKIVIISAVFPPEPIVSANISYDIAEELSQNNIVSVVCPNPSRPIGFKFEKSKENKSFKINVVNSYTCPESKLFGRIWESLSFGKKSQKYIEQNHNEIDVIYMNVWPLLAQFFIVLTAKKFKIKVIAHIQDIYPESYTNKTPIIFKHLLYWALLPIDKYVLKYSNHIIAISEKMKNHLLNTRFLQPDKITVINNWQDENDFINFQRSNNKISKHRKLTFMYLGNIGPVADVELIIESFGMAKLTEARLIIAGAGTMKQHCQNLSRKYIYSNIEFIDVPAGKVPEIQDQADVMLLPLKKGAAISSIPSKLPAYMFSKKPIIGCVDAESDTANSIISSGCGWVVKPENRERLIELFKTIKAESQESRTEKGKNGFNYAIEKYTKSRNLKKITDLFLESNKKAK